MQITTARPKNDRNSLTSCITHDCVWLLYVLNGTTTCCRISGVAMHIRHVWGRSSTSLFILNSTSKSFSTTSCRSYDTCEMPIPKHRGTNSNLSRGLTARRSTHDTTHTSHVDVSPGKYRPHDMFMDLAFGRCTRWESRCADAAP